MLKRIVEWGCFGFDIYKLSIYKSGRSL